MYYYYGCLIMFIIVKLLEITFSHHSARHKCIIRITRWISVAHLDVFPRGVLWCKRNCFKNSTQWIGTFGYWRKNFVDSDKHGHYILCVLSITTNPAWHAATDRMTSVNNIVCTVSMTLYKYNYISHYDIVIHWYVMHYVIQYNYIY